MDEKSKYIFDDNLDSRMERDIQNMRRQRHERDRKRRTKKTVRRVILAVIGCSLCVVIAASLVKLFSTDVYQSSDEFAEFAESSLDSYELTEPNDTAETQYYFDEGFSYAVRADSGICNDVKNVRDQEINAIISHDKKRIEKEIADSESKTSIVKALIVDSASFETGNGAISVYIQYNVFRSRDREMVLESSKVKTFLYSDAGSGLDSLQVLNVNYKTIASKHASEYFDKTYNEEDRRKGYKDFISDDDSNFNSFFMTGDNIVFLFDQETVLKFKYAVVPMSISYSLIESSIRPEVLNRYIDKDKPMVAITYDDGPGDSSEKKILKYLERNGSVATFFYLGNRVESFKENGRRAVKIGCEIGNHSWDHPVMSTLSKKQIKSQINKTNNVIEEVCGVEPVVARPPYGDFNKSVLKSTGMAEILWTVDTLDWKTRSPKKIFKEVKKHKNLDGSIILMHSIYDETAKATKKILPWLKKHGYQTVTVSELIKYKTGKAPKPGKLYREVK